MEEDFGEFIVIGVDNSRSVPRYSDIFQNLCRAIEIYCRTKFKENPKTLVGLYKMSSADFEHLGDPTGSIDEIVAKFPYINPGSGYVDLEGMFTFGCMPLSRHSIFFGQNKIRKKRVVIFTGGCTYLSMQSVKQAAMGFRARGVAIDVIDFYSGVTPRYPFPDSPCRKTVVEALVHWRNGNDNPNSHIVKAGLGSIPDAVSRLFELKSEEQNVTDKRKRGVEESSAAWGSKRRAVEA